MSVGFVALGRHLRKLNGVRAAAHNCSHMDFLEIGVLQQSNSCVFALFASCACSEDFDTYCTYLSLNYTGLTSLPKETKWITVHNYVCLCLTVTQSYLYLYQDIFFRQYSYQYLWQVVGLTFSSILQKGLCFGFLLMIQCPKDKHYIPTPCLATVIGNLHIIVSIIQVQAGSNSIQYETLVSDGRVINQCHQVLECSGPVYLTTQSFGKSFRPCLCYMFRVIVHYLNTSNKVQQTSELLKYHPACFHYLVAVCVSKSLCYLAPFVCQHALPC